MELPILGQWTCSKDEKNRILMPKQVRTVLAQEEGTHLVTTLGHKGCLWVVPGSRWAKESPALLKGMYAPDKSAPPQVATQR